LLTAIRQQQSAGDQLSTRSSTTAGVQKMSKGMDKKKEVKKKSDKTMKEKRAEKKTKQATRNSPNA
jgi:hypothetical protein